MRGKYEVPKKPERNLPGLMPGLAFYLLFYLLSVLTPHLVQASQTA